MRRILVVDDEAGVREFVAEALEADGYETHALPSGEAALAELGKRQYALLLTDLKMPGMSGLELLQRARELQPELEVIVLTAQGSVDVAVDAMKRGAFDFIQKPVSGPQQLRILAARALERRSLLDLKENAAREGAGEPTLSYGDPKMDPVVEALQKAGVLKPVLGLGLPDTFIEHGDPGKLLSLQGLDAPGIEASIRNRFSALVEAARPALKIVA